ncbi:DUF7144 family membrane protein [Streptomyces roseolilacinus]|uniref:DUF7144 domain-containing protein n=1 Tax=Streptomyces roseolilacinus TaxID=66904 RepID=A0A918B3H1_9ACTN|nr:hypothetical protein [Streptomyces roseolilacinus]GGQ13962.1 hypothetical protein GCM10010249_36050 [Streptomyces roseolilacinus]
MSDTAGHGHDRAPGHAHAHHERGGATRTPGGGPAAGGDWASAGAMFAGVLLLVQGVLGMVQGAAGIVEDEVYGVLGGYVFELSVSAWGWIHLVLGLVLAVIGWGVLRGADWARAVGVALASLAVIANFVWLPYQPVWGLVSIAIGVLVVWALCTTDTPPAPR